MKTPIPAIVSASAACVFLVAFAATGFSSIMLICCAWLGLGLAGALWYDHMSYENRRKSQKQDREAIQMLRGAEEFEILCDIESGRMRRRLFDTVAKIDD